MMPMRKLPGITKNTAPLAHYLHKTSNQIPPDDIFQFIVAEIKRASTDDIHRNPLLSNKLRHRHFYSKKSAAGYCHFKFFLPLHR